MSRLKHALVALSVQRQPKPSLANLSSCHFKGSKFLLKFNTAFIGFFAVIALLVLAPVAGLAQNLNSVSYVETKLPASLPTYNYGYAVAISGDTAVVASFSGNKPAYVFVRSGSGWIEQARLTPSDDNGGVFGESVAIDKDTIVIGSPMPRPTDLNLVGAAYVFVRSGSIWTQQQKLTSPNFQSSDLASFGEAVAVNGDTVAVAQDYSQQRGTVHIFGRSNSVWTSQQALVSPTAETETSRLLFGYSLSMSGDTLAVGAPEENNRDANIPLAGAVYVFTRNDSTFALQKKLTAPDPGQYGNFGGSVSVSGDDLVVGAVYAPSMNLPGAAYVFARSGSIWTGPQKLVSSDAEPKDAFGLSVAISGDRLIVGSPISCFSRETSSDPIIVSRPDAAYVFGRSNGIWSEQQRLMASDTTLGDEFGRSIAIGPNNIIIGADHHGSDPNNAPGAAYTFGEEQPQSDTTAPIISGLNNLTITASSSSGAAATFNPTATDDVDGTVPVICAPASGSIFPLGTTTVTCTASDNAGNIATGKFTVTVIYAWSGFLQPINQDGSSIFKLGSTIAVKFQLTGVSSGVQNATAKFSYVKISNKVANGAMKSSTTAAPTSGDLFRYDGISQYIYNWGTKGLTAGTYQLRIELGDGVTHTVNISLK